MNLMEMKRAGINACIDKIGRDFVKKYADSSTSSYGMSEGVMHCFVGVDDAPRAFTPDVPLTLDGKTKFPYFARCTVDNSGVVIITASRVPER